MMDHVRLRLEPDDNRTFLVTCPALPEVTTFGETDEECVSYGRAAIEEALAARIARAAEIPVVDKAPVPSTGRVLMVTLPLMVRFKLALYWNLREVGITRAELARRLDWNRTSVDRLFRLDHASRLEQIEAAAGALGKQINPEFVDA